MKIIISTIGKYKKQDALQSILAEYLKRLPWEVKLLEYECKSNVSGAELKEKEGELLLNAIPKDAYVIALDERGKAYGSREFAAQIQKRFENAQTIAFIIGGADGLSDAVKERANQLIAFGNLTWPHKLVRVMLLEQIYRAFTIVTNHPYHRD